VRKALGVLDSAAILGAGAISWSPRGTESRGASDTLTVLPSAVPAPFFGAAEVAIPGVDAPGPESLGNGAFRDVPSLLQLRRTFMLYEHEEGVVLIDQHSAHERVLYERFLREMEQGGATSQRLLLPETLHLSPDEGEALELHGEALARLGYELESFGGHSVIVHAVPLPHPRFDALQCLRETLQALSGDRSPASHARHERLLATVACKAAVKAGDPLSVDEMRALFRALSSTALPAHDVHGRTGILRLTWDELDRRFGRR
jgi:DNA mismatch repair protein MutL